MAGLFSGLGKFGAGGGGLLGGAHDALLGTTPGMTSTPQAAIAGPGGEMLQQAPQVQATGGMTGGLLDKLGGFMDGADDRGLTGRDKLFAIGSVLQGDSGGAASYLGQQRQAADVLAERKRQQETQAAGLAALQGAIDPATGQLDYRKYLAALPAGADPTAGLKTREALMPDIAPISGEGGAVNLFDRAKGAFVPGGIAGRPRQPERFIQDENGDWTPNPIYMQALQGEAAARRRGAPPVGRSGGGKAAAVVPKPTGRSY